MKYSFENFSSPENIRSAFLKEDTAADSVVLPSSTDSRLTIPLTTALRNVASSVAVIGSLPPSQRKDASEKLIDISEAALLAVEKTLKRSGTADPTLLQQVRKINKLLAEFDESFTVLPVSEGLAFEGENPDEISFDDDPDGTPKEFDSGEAVSTISPVAIRILSDNSDMTDPNLAKGDPAADVVDPPAGEASPETVDTSSAEDKVINALASASDNLESDLPEEFKPKAANESIHDLPGENLKLIEILCKNM